MTSLTHADVKEALYQVMADKCGDEIKMSHGTKIAEGFIDYLAEYNLVVAHGSELKDN